MNAEQVDAAAAVAARITGTTRLYAVLGDPIDQVRAPALLNPVFARLGIESVLVPVHAAPGDLAEIVTGLRRVGNLDGLLVTVPHKAAMCRFADRISPAVALTGSTNALRRESDGTWSADNFDGVGFVRGLLAAGHHLAGRHVLLVGAGGAGSAIAAAVLEAGAGRLTLRDRDAGRLRALVARLSERWPGRVGVGTGHVLGAADIVVNATPLGMRPDDALPFDPAKIAPRRVVADIIMKPRETRLLRAAAALGHQVHYGIHMLNQQLDLYREFFRLEIG